MSEKQLISPERKTTTIFTTAVRVKSRPFLKFVDDTNLNITNRDLFAMTYNLARPISFQQSYRYVLL